MKNLSNSGRGRPRSEESRLAILAASFSLICEKGYSKMTIEGVAAQAQVGKATIYRWWTTRQELAVDAFFASTQEALAFPETGSAREDFRQQIHQLTQLLRGAKGEAMAAMIAASRHDPVLRQALSQRWVAPRKKWGQERIVKAIREGECLEGVQPEPALDVLYSPIYARLLFGLGIPTEAEVEAYLALAFRGIFRKSKRGTRK